MYIIYVYIYIYIYIYIAKDLLAAAQARLTAEATKRMTAETEAAALNQRVLELQVACVREP
jgi:hypothetical protein